MHMSKIRTTVAALVSASLAAGAPVPALGQATSLSDLVYQGDSFAARELPKRGYVLTHTDVRDGKAWQYWWNAQAARCARVTVAEGRVTDARDTDEHDCDQQPGENKSGMSDGAKIALAAAAILGVAALAHKSHENSKERAKQQPQDVAEFERGFRDGLYHQGFHNYNNTSDYANGYQKGAEKRDAETSYRPGSGYHSGTASYVNVQDLVGARGSSVDGELRARGFASKGAYQDSGRAVSMWWNARTRQCLNMVVSDGRAKQIRAINENNCL